MGRYSHLPPADHPAPKRPRRPRVRPPGDIILSIHRTQHASPMAPIRVSPAEYALIDKYLARQSRPRSYNALGQMTIMGHPVIASTPAPKRPTPAIGTPANMLSEGASAGADVDSPAASDGETI